MANRYANKAYHLADDVIERLKKKQPINLTRLQVDNGYSLKSAIAHKGIETKTFKDKVYPVIDVMKEIHNKALDNIRQRDFKRERLDSVVNVAKQMVHDSQLLAGKATENVANNVVVYGSDDFLALQVHKEKSI